MILIQHHLANLPGRKIQQHSRRVGLENHLVFLGQPVKNLTAGLLKLGMKINLRVLHHNQAWNPVSLPDVGFQKREHIDTLHALSHGLHRIPGAAVRRKSGGFHGKQLLFKVQDKPQFFVSPVLAKILIHFPRKIAQIQLIDFVFQQTQGFRRRQVLRIFLFNESDALETVAAFLGLFKNTAAGPKLLQLLILLKH